MNEYVIKGPQDRINWLMVAAFRYCVGRHTTQAMYGVGDVILDNLDVLHTEFIEQFIREIEHEQYVTELDQGRNKRYEIDFSTGIGAKMIINVPYAERKDQLPIQRQSGFILTSVIAITAAQLWTRRCKNAID